MAEKMNEIAHDIIPTKIPSSENGSVDRPLPSLDDVKIDHYKGSAC